MRSRSVFSAILLCLAISVANAAPVDPAADAEAKRLYAEGTASYNLGEFGKAVDSFKGAYKIKPDAVYLYNIAQSYRLMKDYDNAIFFYKSFLRNMPAAPNRVEVEGRMKEMEDAKTKAASDKAASDKAAADKAAADKAAADKAAADHVKIPPPDEVANGSSAGQAGANPGMGGGDTGSKPIYKKWWFWTGIGAVAVTAVVVGVALSGGSASAPGSTYGNTAVF